MCMVFRILLFVPFWCDFFFTLNWELSEVCSHISTIFFDFWDKFERGRKMPIKIFESIYFSSNFAKCSSVWFIKGPLKNVGYFFQKGILKRAQILIFVPHMYGIFNFHPILMLVFSLNGLSLSFKVSEMIRKWPKSSNFQNFYFFIFSSILNVVFCNLLILITYFSLERSQILFSYLNELRV
jgi:hypothetical protein